MVTTLDLHGYFVGVEPFSDEWVSGSIIRIRTGKDYLGPVFMGFLLCDDADKVRRWHFDAGIPLNRFISYRYVDPDDFADMEQERMERIAGKKLPPVCVRPRVRSKSREDDWER